MNRSADGAVLDNLDRAELMDLVHRYAHAVDARRIEDLIALFAATARLEFVSTGFVAHGRVEIGSFFERVFAGPLGPGAVSTHLMTNTVAVPGNAPDIASLQTTAVTYLATDGQVVARGLTYSDLCTRVEGRWLFADRVHRLHWQAAMPGGPMATEPSPVQ